MRKVCIVGRHPAVTICAKDLSAYRVDTVLIRVLKLNVDNAMQNHLCWLLIGLLYIYLYKDKGKDKDLFLGPQEFVVGYSKAPEQLQSSARPICHSHAMTRTGVNQPPYALLHRSSPRYALCHGRRILKIRDILLSFHVYNYTYTVNPLYLASIIFSVFMP